jgi:hypothetical protein
MRQIFAERFARSMRVVAHRSANALVGDRSANALIADDSANALVSKSTRFSFHEGTFLSGRSV